MRTSAWMPDRKIVPCSSTYLSRSVVSGRASLTGRPRSAASGAIVAPSRAAIFCVVVCESVAATGVPSPSPPRWSGNFTRWSGDLTSAFRPRRFEAPEMPVHHLVERVRIPAQDARQRLLMDGDRPLGHERLVHRHVARDLELAEQHPHQPLNGRVARGTGQREVELHVELEEA